MCGICLSVVPHHCKEEHLSLNAFPLIRRGPDVQCSKSVQTKNFACHFLGTVLHLRGDVTPQPLFDQESGNILLWNGEVFGGINIPNSCNDTEILMKEFLICNGIEEFISAISRIEGPWAFVYYQASLKRLWFGRDFLGRRSLLWHLPLASDEPFVISSVGTQGLSFTEVPATGIYSIDLTKNQIELTFYKWRWCSPYLNNWILNGFKDLPIAIDISDTEIKVNISPYNKDVTPSALPCCDGSQSCDIQSLLKIATDEQIILCDKLGDVLSEAVRKRVEFLPDRCSECLKNLISPKNIFCTDEKFREENGVFHLCRCDKCHNQNGLLSVNSGENDCKHCRVAVLFSGGIDSLMLAAIADRHVPAGESIDLLNVAFQQVPKTQQKSKKKSAAEPLLHEDKDPYNVPDRQTGIQGLKELQLVYPNRKWNFVEINIPIEELQSIRADRIHSLVYPLKTVLDDSIGCAIWFAARGSGLLYPSKELYSSTARVILVGMGADEQLGGYSRHRNTFSNRGWSGLVDELEMEISRISERNLGRDDRVITDHGKESRFPFLDEQVVSFLNSIPVYNKVNLNYPRGVGEKYLLRLLAAKMNLVSTASLPKRAIQFGSRIAKSENNKEKASDVCDRLSGVTNKD